MIKHDREEKNGNRDKYSKLEKVIGIRREVG
jgi:hypothetical protein